MRKYHNVCWNVTKKKGVCIHMVNSYMVQFFHYARTDVNFCIFSKGILEFETRISLLILLHSL